MPDSSYATRCALFPVCYQVVLIIVKTAIRLANRPWSCSCSSLNSSAQIVFEHCVPSLARRTTAGCSSAAAASPDNSVTNYHLGVAPMLAMTALGTDSAGTRSSQGSPRTAGGVKPTHLATCFAVPFLWCVSSLVN